MKYRLQGTCPKCRREVRRFSNSTGVAYVKCPDCGTETPLDRATNIENENETNR